MEFLYDKNARLLFTATIVWRSNLFEDIFTRTFQRMATFPNLIYHYAHCLISSPNVTRYMQWRLVAISLLIYLYMFFFLNVENLKMNTGLYEFKAS